MADNVTRNYPPFSWSKAKHQAAELFALDELTNEEIAQKCGVTRKTLFNWRRHPEFKARIQELTEELGEVAERYALAKRGRRLQYLDDLVRRMHQVIRDRAADPSMQGVPGGTSGTLVRKVKGIGSGENFQVVEEYEVDTGLLAELRQYKKQAAQEVGQWSEKHDHSGTTRHEHHFLDLDQLTPDELLRLYQEQIGPTAEDR